MLATYTTDPCIGCHKRSELSLDVAKVARWQAGEFAQNVWPELSPDARELLMTGTHAKCWDAMFEED